MWYKRAIDQHNIEPESFVFSVPFNSGYISFIYIYHIFLNIYNSIAHETVRVIIAHLVTISQ